MTRDHGRLPTPPTPFDAPASRRTVLRVGAHTAWAVPAISLVTAAPALAASGAPSVVATDITCNAGGTDQTRMISATFTNLNTQPTTALMVHFDFEPQIGTVNTQRELTITGDPNWVQLKPPDVDYNIRNAYFVRTADQLTGSGGDRPSVTIAFTMYADPEGPLGATLVGPITVTPMPTPGTGTAGAGALA